jgi:hypothetical protein
MAAFPLGSLIQFSTSVFDVAHQRESSTRHIRKISVAFINIVAGKNCLVRQPVGASKFFRGPRRFFREKFTAFLRPRSIRRAAQARKTLQNKANARDE